MTFCGTTGPSRSPARERRATWVFSWRVCKTGLLRVGHYTTLPKRKHAPLSLLSTSSYYSRERRATRSPSRPFRKKRRDNTVFPSREGEERPALHAGHSRFRWHQLQRHRPRRVRGGDALQVGALRGAAQLPLDKPPVRPGQRAELVPVRRNGRARRTAGNRRRPERAVQPTEGLGLLGVYAVSRAEGGGDARERPAVAPAALDVHVRRPRRGHGHEPERGVV